MQLAPNRSKSFLAAIIVGSIAASGFAPQGARPIDGELGIDANGKINGLLKAESEAVTGFRVSIAIAIGSYASEAEEDAAIRNGTNGSRGFKVISLPGARLTTDLGGPWETGVVLPLCEKATLVVRSVDIRTNAVRIVRNPMQIGMTTVLLAKISPPDQMTQVPQPTFTLKPPPLIPKSRSLPIDGLVGMDSGGRLTGYVAQRGQAYELAVAFVPGQDLTLERGLDILRAGGAYESIPFTVFSSSTELRNLPLVGSQAGSCIDAMRGIVIVKEYEPGQTNAFYSYLEVSAGMTPKWIPTRFPRELPNVAIPTRFSGGISKGIKSRSLPIDGTVTLEAGSGIVSGTMTVKQPVGVRTSPTVELASVGLDLGNGSETSEELLRELRRKDPDLTNSFQSIEIDRQYRLVHTNPGPGQIKLNRGSKVALLFKLSEGGSVEYFVSIISRNGKPPHGR